MKYYLTDSNDEVQGPYGLEEITQLRSSGKVEPTALLCEEGSETWQPLDAILPAASPSAPKPPVAPRPAAQAPAPPTPEVHVNPVVLIGIVVALTLICVAAYFYGMRL
jgi:hypothetical protein